METPIALATGLGEPSSDDLMENLFRREAGRLVARLARRLGSDSLELAEDSVQEALTRALAVWPFKGVPDRPAAWIWRVAHNAAIDRLRADSRPDVHQVEIMLENIIDGPVLEDPDLPTYANEIADDRLALIFACCHPEIALPSRLSLTLKTACGFGVREIASALLVDEPTIAQRLLRARRRLRDSKIDVTMPKPEELTVRLPSVLDTVYLLFNEGYDATEGDDLLRRDLCIEAIELAVSLADHPIAGLPDTQALAALLLFHGARIDTRVDGQGDILLLPDQDRSRWDRQMISEGFRRMEKSQQASAMSEYHLLAGIAACHAIAPTFEETRWGAIRGFYDQLPQTPVNMLNRAVAIAMDEGEENGLRAIDEVRGAPELRRYYLLPATEGELLRRQGRTEEADSCFRRAIELAGTEPVRRFLRRKLG